PAARSRATHTASRIGRKPRRIAAPYSVSMSAVSIRSLTATGTPWSGPRGGSASARAGCARRADARGTKALIRGARAASGATQAPTMSRDLMRFAAIALAASPRPSRVRSSSDIVREMGDAIAALDAAEMPFADDEAAGAEVARDGRARRIVDEVHLAAELPGL